MTQSHPAPEAHASETALPGPRPGLLARLRAWLFPPEPEPPLVDVGRVQVKVVLASGYELTKTFEGSTFLSFGAPFTTSATDRALYWIDSSHPIALPDGKFIPRHAVAHYELGLQEPHLVRPT